MMRLENFNGIYLHKERVDFRMQINGLAAIVEGEMKLSPFERYLFVFCNIDRTRLKILYWNRTGFAMWQMRLEKDKFPWPHHLLDDVVGIQSMELRWLLDGYDFWKIKPHSTVEYACVS
jgi:transposase